jgi:hypothetical protein
MAFGIRRFENVGKWVCCNYKIVLRIGIHDPLNLPALLDMGTSSEEKR